MNGLTGLLAAVVGYLLGSLSFARLGVRLFAPDRDLADLTVAVEGTEDEAAIKAMGANSASMIIGANLGGLVALLDMLKVALPVLVFRLCCSDQPYAIIVAVAGLVGHNWPIYYRFQGGRGFSVILGAFFVIDWLGAAVTLGAGLLLGTLVFGSTIVADLAWLLLMIPWMWIRHQDGAYLLFAILANAFFFAASVPDIKTVLKFRREGKLDAYMDALHGSSARARGIKALADTGKSVRKTLFRIAPAGLVVVLVLGLVGPFLVPIPPLEDTVPPEALADPDSRFIEIDDLQVHYKTAGEGEPLMILLHGFGASVFSWRELMHPLGERGTAVAFDRPAFGLTERPLSWQEGANPYTAEAQVALVMGLMDRLGADQAVLVGHSAGGTVAVHTALAHPDRVSALVLVAPAIYEGGGAPSWIRPLLNAPQVDRLGPLLARQIKVRGDAFLEGAWYDPNRITPAERAGYRKPLRVDNWDRALWELTKASNAATLADRVGDITLPTLVISGDQDRVVPLESSVRLADALPTAELIVIPDCGHVPHEECPEPVLVSVQAFLSRLEN